MNDLDATGSPPRPARARWLALAAGAALVLLGLASWRWWTARQTDETPTRAAVVDPRLAFPTPYRNVRPDVKYVGDQVCANCHHHHVESYSQHPMGQALAPTAAATRIERYEQAAHNPFIASSLHYDIQRRDNRVFHRQWGADPDNKPLAEIEAEVHFAIGSGARARSYSVNHDGYLFQSPVTWYPQGGRWDLSPSYEIWNQHFSRPIMPGCLFCHCNQVEHVPDTVNRYRQPIFLGYAIGCERCHGPGELHVQRREAGERVKGPDDTIVNPARLEHSLREDVCHQCHVQGEQRIVARGRSDFDYRPGLPLHLFLMDFVDGREERDQFKFVSSVEQLRSSRCYLASQEPKKLGCVSCHDPHRHPRPEEKIAHYRGRCLQCHTDTSCSLPEAVRREKSKEDSCIACHMPRLRSEVNHTAITDHRVPRRAVDAVPAGPMQRATPGPSDLVPFHRNRASPDDEEVSRNLGLAVMAMVDRRPPEAVERQYAEAALPLLERAFQRDDRDWPVCHARANALWGVGRHEEALSAFEAILSEKPDFETALHGAGNLALERNRLEAARSYLERAVRVNPWRRHYHHGLAVASFRRGEWDRAVKECQQALRLEPSNSPSRSLLVQCYLCLGHKDKARAEYETLRQLVSENRRADLRLWFEQQQRRLAPQD